MTQNQKAEALSVQRLINEVLIQKLGIPAHNIVNDMTFPPSHRNPATGHNHLQ